MAEKLCQLKKKGGGSSGGGGTAQISATDIPPGNNSKTLSVNKGDIITLCLVPIGNNGVTATISNVVGADVLASSAQTVSSMLSLIHI